MKKEVILFVFVLLVVSLTSAEISVGEPSHSISKQYFKDDSVKGFVNINLTKHPVNSMIQGSLGNTNIKTINLIDFMRLGGIFKGTDYVCTPSNCQDGSYSIVDGSESTSKDFKLLEGKDETYAFKLEQLFSGSSTEVTSFNLTVDAYGGAGISDTPQLEIDILNDGIPDWEQNIASTELEDYNYGCFNKSASTRKRGFRTDSYYCQEIYLNKTIGVNVGFGLAEVGSENAGFDVRLVKADGSSRGCSAYYTHGVTDRNHVFCNVDFNNSRDNQKFSICVKPHSGYNIGENYKIKIELNKNCGYIGDGNKEVAFDIYAREKKFADVGRFQLGGSDLVNKIDAYIESKYRKDCKSQSCIIPIKFSAAKNQSLRVGLNVDYNDPLPESVNELYNYSSSNAVVSTKGFKRVALDGNGFSVGNSTGQKEFSLYLGNNKLFSETISIQNRRGIIINSLSPKIASEGIRTSFRVNFSNPDSLKNIKYSWNFGDGSTPTSSNLASAYHTYNKSGNYTLNISITTDNNTYSKTFPISVGSMADVVNKLLNEKRTSLNKITEEIEQLPDFDKSVLKKMLGLEELNKTLSELENKSTSIDKNTYNEIANVLKFLNVPLGIESTNQAPTKNYFPKNRINIKPNVLKDITGENYNASKKEVYVKFIDDWQRANTKVVLNSVDYSATYENGNKEKLSVYRLDVNVSNKFKNVYLIMLGLENQRFNKGYTLMNNSKYFAIKLNESNNFKFSTTQQVRNNELPFFVSVSLKEFASDEPVVLGEKTWFQKYWLFLFISVAVFLVGGGVGLYVLLKIWYKRKYEATLFKDKDELPNLFRYIKTARNKMKDKKIRMSLLRQGWKREQISYAIREFDRRNKKKDAKKRRK